MNDFAINSKLTPNANVVVANAVNAAMSANQAGTTDITGLAEFNERAGVRHRQHGQHAGLALQQRRLLPAPRRPPSRPAQNAGSAAGAGGVDDLHAAGTDVIDALRRGGKSELEDMLAGEYDALERHALLRNARAQVDAGDLSETEKDALKNSLNGMMSDLMDTHGDVIRMGLKDAGRFEAAVDDMDALSQAADGNRDPDSLRTLRALYGAKGQGRHDAALTPLALAKTLQDKFGVASFSRALDDLRSKMARDFRANPAIAGPRLWLSLSDAASFNAVQSGFAIAGELRRDLSERAGILLAPDQAATAMALLGVAELGVTRGDAFIWHLVDSKNSPLLKRMQLYVLVRQAVEKLPIALWQAEALPQRMKLLDELRALAVALSGEEPYPVADEAALQRQLRGKVHRQGKRDQEGGRGQDQDHDQEGAGDSECDDSRTGDTAEE